MGVAGEDPLAVSVRNLGGIESVEATFEPGVTVLVGPNATNRTSLLRSIAAALGGSCGELNAAADAGSVALEVGDDRYEREFERDGDAVRVDGSPYTDEVAVVDHFACLLEANPVRRAIERGDDAELRDLLLSPVDTGEIERRVAAAARRLEHVDDRLAEIERRQSNLPALRARRSELSTDLEAIESELEDVRGTMEAYADEAASVPDAAADGAPAPGSSGTDAPPTGTEATEPGRTDAETTGAETMDELADARAELQRVRDERDTQERAVASLEEERASVADELDDLGGPDADLDDVEAELETHQRRERDLAATVDSLQSIVEFNQGLVDGPADLHGTDDPVAALDPGSRELECWTCGTVVERGAIADRLDDLRAVVADRRAERSEVADRVETLRERCDALREHARERTDLESRLDDLDDELADRRQRVSELADREAELEARVTELEAAAADEGAAEREFLEASRRHAELAYDRGQLEEQLASVDDEIAAIEALDAEREDLEDERAALREERRELRGRIEAIEADVVETFNDQVATVLELLAYDNVARVWIERTSADGDDASTFDLHVVREADAVYEDTLDHLSESEREVIGLVVALTGALVHDVEATVPVVLLDSLEAIDADRIATLVDHVADVAPYLVVALLPEDARALPERYRRRRMGGDAA